MTLAYFLIILDAQVIKLLMGDMLDLLLSINLLFNGDLKNKIREFFGIYLFVFLYTAILSYLL